MTAFYDDKLLEDEIGQGDLDFAYLFEYEAPCSDNAPGSQGLSEVILFVCFCFDSSGINSYETLWGICWLEVDVRPFVHLSAIKVIVVKQEAYLACTHVRDLSHEVSKPLQTNCTFSQTPQDLHRFIYDFHAFLLLASICAFITFFSFYALR